MSQSGSNKVNTGSLPPSVPLQFTSDSGIAVPVANNLNVFGTTVAAGSIPFRSIASGSTVTYQTQISQATASTDATKIGLAAFDSSSFAVDANGFVTLTGGSAAILKVNLQTGTSPIVPTAGAITLNGAVVAAGTHPVRTDGTGASTGAIEIQISQAIAASDSTKIGLSNFNSAQFIVDANGFVSLNGSSSILTLTGDSGVATPIAGNINVQGTTSGAFFTGTAGNLIEKFNFLTFDQPSTSTTGYIKFPAPTPGSSQIITTFGNTGGAFANTNFFVGNACGNFTNTGYFNIGISNNSFTALTSGYNNIALQSTSLGALTTGHDNVAIGNGALLNLTTGIQNLALGNLSPGSNYTTNESNNIVIQNVGVIGDNNVTRIGTQGNGTGQSNQCFIAGIVGVTNSNAEYVTINSSTGQLGVIAINPSGFPWNDVTGATQTLAVNNGYITDHAATVIYTLPATAALGDTIKIVGKLGLATITPNANQQIVSGSASGTVGATGTLVSNNVGDCVTLICITSGANTVYRVDSIIGTWTLS